MFLRILIIIAYARAGDITLHDIQLFLSRTSELIHFFLKKCFNYESMSFGSDIF